MSPRIIVAGGTGFFGRAAVELLRSEGQAPLVASRREGADVRLDVEDRKSLATALRPGDVVLDAVGPFQDRSTALLEAAIQTGCHLVDLSDSLAYAIKVHALRSRIDERRVCVLSSASSISAVSAALVRLSGIANPVRVSGFLAPASRYSASQGAGASLLRSVGRPVQVLGEGRLAAVPGFTRSRRFDLPPPVGRLTGRLYESADSFWLPLIWTGLRTVDFYIDTHVPGMNALLSLAARRPWLRRFLERFESQGRVVTRWLGSKRGCLGVEVEGADGHTSQLVLVPADHGYQVAVAPAVLAALHIADGRFPHRGLVLPDRHVEPPVLIAWLKRLGVGLVEA